MSNDTPEHIASVLLQRTTTRGVLFTVLQIGGNWPTIDLYAELETPDLPNKYFCFFQVKSTIQGYNKTNKKLKVKIKLLDLNRLSSYTAPTYLIGIDHNQANPFQSVGFIQTIRGNYLKGMSSMSVANVLNIANLELLYDEVIEFWDSTNVVNRKTIYVSNF